MPDMICKAPKESEPPPEEPPLCTKLVEVQGNSYATGLISRIYDFIGNTFRWFNHRNIRAEDASICTIFSSDRAPESIGAYHSNRQHESLVDNWATIRFVRSW